MLIRDSKPVERCSGASVPSLGCCLVASRHGLWKVLPPGGAVAGAVHLLECYKVSQLMHDSAPLGLRLDSLAPGRPSHSDPRRRQGSGVARRFEPRIARRLWAGALCVVLAAGSSNVAGQDAPTAQELQQAQARWNDGRAAFDRGNFEMAWIAFKQAYAAYPHPALLQNLGETELRTGRFVDAARHLSLYLRTGVPTESERKLAARSLTKASERLGAVVVTTDAAGAEVRIDGELIGKTPSEDAPWYVEPGEHTIVLHKDGYVDGRIVLNVASGPPTKTAVSLKPMPVPAAPAGGSAEAAAAPSRPGSPRDHDSSSGTRTMVLASEGLVSVAGVAIGIGYLLAGNSADEQGRSYQARVDAAPLQPACSAPTGSVQQDCQALHNAIADRQRDRTISAVGFVGAGLGLAALAATLVLWKQPAQNATPVRVDAGPDRVSAIFTWRYE